MPRVPPVQSSIFNIPQSDWENLASLLSLAVAGLSGVLLVLGLIPGRWIESVEEAFRRWAGPTSLWFVLLPALSLAINIGIACHKGIPRPIIHDEFSYLLAGDTFAHGRLTNPQPPFPGHFETPQELMRPSRMSKYPPGQGLFIALGQVLTGYPIVGIWISTAAAVAAIYWAMLGFVPRPWALVGGWIAVCSPALLHWSQVYWGGNVAVLGGALLLGGWGRLMVRPTISSSVALWVGVAVLANSRPFEGLMTAGPLVVGLAWRWSSWGQTFETQVNQDEHRTLNIEHRRWKLRAARLFPSSFRCSMFSVRCLMFAWLFPGIVVIAPTAAAMGYYNHRITGHALRMPFSEYTARYDLYPKFWFQPLRPMPNYGNRSQKWVHTDFEKGQYDQLRTLGGFLGIAPLRAGGLLNDNLKLAALFIPFGAALALLRDVRLRWCFMSAGFLLIGLWCENFDLPHYSAPVNPVMLVLTVAGLAKLWNWTAPTLKSVQASAVIEVQIQTLEYRQKQPEVRRYPRTALLVISILAGTFAGSAMCACQGVTRESQIVQQTTLVELQPALNRGRHLIFVNYGPMTELTNGFANEFVYNPADLESSRIIWVRYFGAQSDRPVAEHFAGRKTWMLSVGGKLELVPYLKND